MDILSFVVLLPVAAVCFGANVMVGHLCAEVYFIWSTYRNESNYRSFHAPILRQRLRATVWAMGVALSAMILIATQDGAAAELIRASPIIDYARRALVFLGFMFHLRDLRRGKHTKDAE